MVDDPIVTTSLQVACQTKETQILTGLGNHNLSCSPHRNGIESRHRRSPPWSKVVTGRQSHGMARCRGQAEDEFLLHSIPAHGGKLPR